MSEWTDKDQKKLDKLKIEAVAVQHQMLACIFDYAKYEEKINKLIQKKARSKKEEL
jgi:hypothetical protein